LKNKSLWVRFSENLSRRLGLLAALWFGASGFVTLGFMLLGFAGTVQGQTYKWTDEDGRVHFSDSPPKEQKKDLEEVDIQVNQLKYDPLVHERRKSQKKLLNAIVEEKQAKQKAEQERKNKAAKEKHKCDQLRAQYQRYKYAGAVYRRDRENPAERIFYSDEERAAYLSDIQKKISKNCKR